MKKLESATSPETSGTCEYSFVIEVTDGCSFAHYSLLAQK